MNPRQIRYKRITDTGTREFLNQDWILFLLNTKEETRRIKQKIIGYFTSGFYHCDDLEELDSGILIREGALVGKLITLKSNAAAITEEARQQIYATPKWYYDRTLRPMDDVQFERYCQQFKR